MAESPATRQKAAKWGNKEKKRMMDTLAVLSAGSRSLRRGDIYRTL
jgi:hypothetical protein